MCRQRRIARFGSLCEGWRTVLFELVFAPCYAAASTGSVRPYHESRWASTEYLAPVAPVGGFLYSPIGLPRGQFKHHKNFARVDGTAAEPSGRTSPLSPPFSSPLTCRIHQDLVTTNAALAEMLRR